MLDHPDRLAWVEAFGAGLGAVHDGVAAVELEAVVQRLQTLLGLLVSRINDPAVGLHIIQINDIRLYDVIYLEENGRSKVLIGAPPVRRTGRRAARAENALVQPIELLAVLLGLQELPVLQVVAALDLGLQPGLDVLVLGEEVAQVRHKVAEHVHLRYTILF